MIDEIDRQLLNTIHGAPNITLAQLVKLVAPNEKKGAFQKLYQKLRYRVNALIDDGLIIETEKTHELSLADDVWYGVLELVDKNGKNYRELEVGKTIVVEDDGKGAVVIFLEEGK